MNRPGWLCSRSVYAAVTSAAGTRSTDRMPLATPIRDVPRTTSPICGRLLPWPAAIQSVE